MAEMNIPCGISLDTANARLFDHLLDYCDDVPALFIDSGAFSEKAHKPFTVQDWRSKLRKYKVLTRAYSDRCVFVAPDKIGDQQESINRLRLYQPILQELMTQSHMIVPLQKGDMTQAEMYEAAVELFSADIVAGIPFKKAATSYEEYQQFMRTTAPRKVHILGVTPFGARWRKIKQINEEFTAARVTFDGCRIRSIVGRDKPFTRGMHARKHLPRHEAIYETLMSIPQCFKVMS